MQKERVRRPRTGTRYDDCDARKDGWMTGDDDDDVDDDDDEDLAPRRAFIERHPKFRIPSRSYLLR